jgi:hypothetical protein
MATLIQHNTLDRDDWVRAGLALVGSIGPEPAIDESEAANLFDTFSQAHPSYDQRDVRRFWRDALGRPVRATFGTLIGLARDLGFTGAELEIVQGPISDPVIIASDEATLRRAMKSFGADRGFVVASEMLPWFAPTPDVQHVLATGVEGQDGTFEFVADAAWRAQKRGLSARIRLLPQKEGGLSPNVTPTPLGGQPQGGSS